jgi:hypothetical protein
MKKTTMAMLVALLGAFAATAVLATPQQAFAQSASSTGAATDTGSAASGAGANFPDGTSGSSSAAGGQAAAAGGDFAACPASQADDGGCSIAVR